LYLDPNLSMTVVFKINYKEYISIRNLEPIASNPKVLATLLKQSRALNDHNIVHAFREALKKT